VWLVREFLALRVLFWRTVRSLGRRRWQGREVVEQAYQFTNQSLLFIAVTMGFVAMIMVFQACFQAQRILGDLSLIGPAYLQLVVREFAPTIGALMVATRVGAGIAAEIGSMTVTEQVDALRMSGADPVDTLVSPRILAGLVAMIVLGILGAAFMFGVGAFVAEVAFKVPPKTFFSVRLIRMLDVASFLNKCAVFGFVVPLVAARAGFSARGGSGGVGGATTRAVIECSLWILLFDLSIGAFYFGLQRLTET
jgi:phospholipid/cholesterol/gamma-HCH transport system permease protein